jgi:hypothetical protein
VFSVWYVESVSKEVFGSIEQYRTVVEFETPAYWDMCLELKLAVAE